jgi:hypothetical protein
MQGGDNLANSYTAPGGAVTKTPATWASGRRSAAEGHQVIDKLSHNFT